MDRLIPPENGVELVDGPAAGKLHVVQKPYPLTVQYIDYDTTDEASFASPPTSISPPPRIVSYHLRERRLPGGYTELVYSFHPPA